MNYLANNIGNSLLLPCDVMKLIYEYADPLVCVKKQIENKECDLDEIMYQRMKKFINNIFYSHSFLNSYTLFAENFVEPCIITRNNVNDIDLKNIFINAQFGYKDINLWKTQRPTNICGIETLFTEYYSYKMIQDLKIVNNKPNYNIYSKKQLYKKWLKL